MINLPTTYEFNDIYNSNFEPSTIHSSNTGLTWYFKRYLVQKLMSVFEFENIPDNWDRDYFNYTLFVFGFIAVVNTKQFGVIPQWCTLFGRDVYYRPTNAVISNPLIKGFTTPRIGKQCTLIKMQPDYGGAWDIISFYADMLALCAEAAAVNLLNSKLAYVFAAETKTMAESFKKLYDTIASGQPAAFIDKALYNEDGKPAWEIFNQNLKNTYIAGDILEDMAKWDSRFNTEIGIPNVNIAKASGVSANEIEANNIDTQSKAHLWLETIKRGLDQTNKMFGTNITVKLRFDKEVKEIGYGMAVNNGNV